MLHRHRFNKVRPGKMADIFQTIFTFLNEHMWNSIQISWKCISRVAIKNIPELVQIMAAPLSLNGLIIFTISRPVKQPWRIDDEINVIHYSDVIMSTIACLITSLAVVYSTVYSDADQKYIKAPRHWPLCGEFTGTGEFPAQRASYAENVSIWWRHHVNVAPVTNKYH